MTSLVSGEVRVSGSPGEGRGAEGAESVGSCFPPFFFLVFGGILKVVCLDIDDRIAAFGGGFLRGPRQPPPHRRNQKKQARQVGDKARQKQKAASKHEQARLCDLVLGKLILAEPPMNFQEQP